ncbi:hypothetical protein [Photobacterium aquae]|nr:hypothetical protein [Photobacterium aquae]
MSTKDLCGAWEMPTTAKREACGFYIPKVTSKEKRADTIAN